MTTSASSPVGQVTFQSHSRGVPRTRRTLLCTLLAIFLGAATQSASAANPQTRYYGHEAAHDEHGVIAPWYHGLNGQCDLRVRIAAETLKRYPWTTTKDAVADDKFLGGLGFYVKGVEGKIPGGK